MHKWTIAQFKGGEDRPAREFELVPDATGYRKPKFAKELGGEVRIVYEAGLRIRALSAADQGWT